MRNREGTPIWYELLTNDSKASTAFYESVIGWKVPPAAPGTPHGYQMIDTAGAHVGGMMQLTDDMKKNGAKPTWLFYVGVDDVGATAKKVEPAGGKLLMQPFDIPGAGRAAMVADPQGIPFYVMRGSTDGMSTAFERTGMGKCNWNELATPDQASANAFYAALFGWTYPDKMPMGEAGDYVFIAVGDERIGATMKQGDKQPSGWTFYFRVPDIDAAVEKVKAGGGQVHAGPMDVPGGDRVIVASDPQGVPFGIAAPGKAS
jgi:predicted enzyme related to lactoylglutathione lyase